MGLGDLFGGNNRKPGFNKGDKSTGGKFKKAPIVKPVIPTSNPRKKIEPWDVREFAYGPQTPQIQKLIVRFNNITKEDNERLYQIKRGGDTGMGIIQKNLAKGRVRDALWLKGNQEPWSSRIGYYNSLKIEFAKKSPTPWADGAFNDALLALIMKDLIGQGFSQENYDTLMDLWKEGIGILDESK